MYIARRSQLSECVQSAQDYKYGRNRETNPHNAGLFAPGKMDIMSIKLVYPVVCICALLCQACMQSVCVHEKLHHALLMAYVFLRNSVY